MPTRSPPKHRHDGASPLPLGMDWSPPPRKWDGRDTVWPHDPRTGWSFCVMIPSWATRPQQKSSDGSSTDPVVFYRVVVGVQSPEGISTSRGVFRRFNDFLKLYNVLKRLYPRKNLPPPPPKHRFLRISSSQSLLEERRFSLEDWMGKLLYDIDISRSVPIASFLELEASARTSFIVGDQHAKSANPDVQNGSSSPPLVRTMSESFYAGSSSTASKAFSFASDYGSDNTYEASEVGTPRLGTDNNSEIGSEDLSADHYLTATASMKCGIPNDDSGLLTEDTIIEQAGDSRDRSETGIKSAQKEILLGYTSKVLLSDSEKDKGSDHARKMSAESFGSDASSCRSSEQSNPRIPNSCDHLHLNEFPGPSDAVGLNILNNIEVVLPLDQRNKMNRVLITMQRRLATARTDMEDLIARLNQETAAKEYLTTKVRELDVELETNKQRSKENLQQAILLERERMTQMQWDMEEIRRKSLEMEAKLKFEKDEKVRAELSAKSAINERDSLAKELALRRKQLADLQKRQEELDSKSKSDVKVLVKEVKSLRISQNELKHELDKVVKEKSELEIVLQREHKEQDLAALSRKKLLNECKILRERLQECTVSYFSDADVTFSVDSSSLADAMGLLATSDNRIALLLAEAQLLAQDDETVLAAAGEFGVDKFKGNAAINNGKTNRSMEEDIRKMLADILVDNAQLRKQVNFTIRCALKSSMKPDKPDCEENQATGDATNSIRTVFNKFLERKTSV